MLCEGGRGGTNPQVGFRTYACCHNRGEHRDLIDRNARIISERLKSRQVWAVVAGSFSRAERGGYFGDVGSGNGAPRTKEDVLLEMVAKHPDMVLGAEAMQYMDAGAAKDFRDIMNAVRGTLGEKLIEDACIDEGIDVLCLR